MKRKRNLIILPLVVSVPAGIIFPFAISSKPINWHWFFLVMPIGFSGVWFIYIAIFFVSTFVSGRINLKKRFNEETSDKWRYS